MTMAITAEQVKKLRDKTGAGMMECKAALTEANGDFEEAITILRKRGLAQAAKRAGPQRPRRASSAATSTWAARSACSSRSTASPTSSRAPTTSSTLVKEIAMHIAAADPKYVRREDVPAEALEKEKAIYRAQMESSGKPAKVIEKIVEGKLGSFYSQVVLLDQPSIRDPNVTVGAARAAGHRQDRREHRRRRASSGSRSARAP